MAGSHEHLLTDGGRKGAEFVGQCHFKSEMIFLQFLKQFYSQDGATLSIVLFLRIM